METSHEAAKRQIIEGEEKLESAKKRYQQQIAADTTSTMNSMTSQLEKLASELVQKDSQIQVLKLTVESECAERVQLLKIIDEMRTSIVPSTNYRNKNSPEQQKETLTESLNVVPQASQDDIDWVARRKRQGTRGSRRRQQVLQPIN